MTDSNQFTLRKLLLLDALTCGAMALLLTLAGKPLAPLLALPAPLLWYTGVLLIPIAAFMAVTALKGLTFRPAVWIVIGGNELWVLASIALLVGDWVSPNALGYAFIGVQAVVVAALAFYELRVFRRGSLSPGLA